jgi:hypothetical protein
VKRTPAVHLVKAKSSILDLGLLADSVILQSYNAATIGCVRFVDIPDSTSLADVFRFYRLNKLFVKLEFPFQDMTPNSTPLVTDRVDQGRIYLVLDPRHSINPSTITEAALLEMGADVKRYDVKACRGIVKFKVDLYNLMPAYVQAPVGTGENYLVRKKDWHQTTCNTTIFTWGFISFYSKGLSTIVEQKCELTLKYYFSLKGNK